MNREIKYKAFVKSIKTLWDVVGIFYDKGKISEVRLDFEGNEGDVFEYKIDEVNLLQYTGLKDKDGKEIYEGNVVYIPSWEPHIWQVGFNRGGFCFYQTEDDNYYNDCKYLEGCEVKGNIYEKPELLNK